MTSDIKTALWICEGCGYIYDQADGDERTGIAPGTALDALPETWDCPSCGGLKSDYSPLDPASQPTYIVDGAVAT